MIKVMAEYTKGPSSDIINYITNILGDADIGYQYQNCIWCFQLTTEEQYKLLKNKFHWTTFQRLVIFD